MSHTSHRIAAGLVAAGLVTAPLALAAPAHADIEKHGQAGKGVYEFSVDRDNGGFEVSVDLDGLPRGQRWTIVLRHDGKVVAKVTRKADREGDIELERRLPDSAGQDVFRFKAKRVGGNATCGAKITVG